MINLSVGMFLELAIMTHNDFASELKYYKESLEIKIEKVLGYFCEIMNYDWKSLSFEEFVETFEHPIVRPLLSSSDIRRFIIKF